MFMVLSVINIPLFVIYPSPTKFNDYSSIESLITYMTLGNLARPNLECGYSDLKKDIIYGEKERSPEIKLQCDTGEYISKITDFGLLYREDKETGSKSDGYTQCMSIKNPHESKEKWLNEIKDEEEAKAALVIKNGLT